MTRNLENVIQLKCELKSGFCELNLYPIWSLVGDACRGGTCIRLLVMSGG